MEVDRDDLVTIVNASKIQLQGEENEYLHRGTTIDMYKFCYKEKGWEHGEIFHANNGKDICFSGIREDISAQNSFNKRAAQFLVLEPDEQDIVEDMMERSSSLKHVGILKPYVAGFNTQISKVVCGFSETRCPLREWLEKNKPSQRSSISVEVQHLIRTGYLAIEMIWKKGLTSDALAGPVGYRMIDAKLKINPLCIRKRREGENDQMPLRRAYGRMIRKFIFDTWGDVELLDFIELLGTPAARNASDVLGHPILLSPSGRELMYHKFDSARTTLTSDQERWLESNIPLSGRWKEFAANADKTLRKIINFQEEQDKKKKAEREEQDKKKKADGEEQDEEEQGVGQQELGFSRDFAGALHFGSVTTSHYLTHFKRTAPGNWREAIKGRVDRLLKEVLPRLLSRRYNANYVAKVFSESATATGAR